MEQLLCLWCSSSLSLFLLNPPSGLPCLPSDLHSRLQQKHPAAQNGTWPHPLAPLALTRRAVRQSRIVPYKTAIGGWVFRPEVPKGVASSGNQICCLISLKHKVQMEGSCDFLLPELPHALPFSPALPTSTEDLLEGTRPGTLSCTQIYPEVVRIQASDPCKGSKYLNATK